jgi:hypothetical protein
MQLVYRYTSADAQGASDPFAVVRCGRNQAQTHVCKATTSPAWFRELFLEVDLPLTPVPKTALKRWGWHFSHCSVQNSGYGLALFTHVNLQSKHDSLMTASAVHV